LPNDAYIRIDKTQTHTHKDNESFDLAGQTAATIEKHIRDAFAEPFSFGDTTSPMIRLTFITGAGKLGRQRYDDGAARAVTTTLRELNYVEDRAASAVIQCAGSFKLQHDTGKNLKTVVVFPKLVVPQEQQFKDLTLQDQKGSTNASTTARANSLLQDGSAEQKLATSSITVFSRMVESKCQSWSQKKECLAALDQIRGMVSSLDAKLLSGLPLTDHEQDFFDSVSVSSLEAKQSQLKELMRKQVEGGAITSEERNILVRIATERTQKLAKDLVEAKEQAKHKRVEALSLQQKRNEERLAMLEGTPVQPPLPLKNQINLSRLRGELAALKEIESNAKGRLLTLKESQAVGRKEEILEEITQQEVRRRSSVVCA
jgi:hypothetical protein